MDVVLLIPVTTSGFDVTVCFWAVGVIVCFLVLSDSQLNDLGSDNLDRWRIALVVTEFGMLLEDGIQR